MRTQKKYARFPCLVFFFALVAGGCVRSATKSETAITEMSGVRPTARRQRPAATKTKQPNFVFFLVDDPGWADLGCFGSEFYETPNIDALCASGMKFTNAYAACPVCSPTRASILTGRHPVRVDITDWIPGMSMERVKDPRLLAVEDRDQVDLGPEREARAHRLFDADLVDDRQHARHGGIDQRNLAIRLGAEFGGRA